MRQRNTPCGVFLCCEAGAMFCTCKTARRGLRPNFVMTKFELWLTKIFHYQLITPFYNRKVSFVCSSVSHVVPDEALPQNITKQRETGRIYKMASVSLLAMLPVFSLCAYLLSIYKV